LKVVVLAMMASLALGVGATARAVMYFSPDSQDVTAVAWSPDGRYILSSGFEGTIRLWRADACEAGPFLYIDDPRLRLREVENGDGPRLAGVMSVAWSPDGRHFAAGLRDRTVRLFEIDPETQNSEVFHEIEVFSHENMGGLRSVAFSPDSSLVASAGHDYSIRIWEAKKHGSMVAELKGHEWMVESITFSSNGSTLLSGSYDGTVRVWDISTKQENQRFFARGQVTSVALSPDNRLAVSLAYPIHQNDFAISVWNTAAGEKVREFGFNTLGTLLTQLAFSPDGIHLASGNLEPGIIRIWNVETGKSEHELSIPYGVVRGISYSKNGRYIVAGIVFGAPIIWNAETGQIVRMLGKCTQH